MFCKIIAGEIPCYRVYEDENVLAFLDIAPCNPGDTLVVYKKHYQNVEAMTAEELGQTMLGVKTVGALLKEKLGYQGYAVSENNDPVAGQMIPHFHWHITPRREGDGIELWPQGKYQEGEAEEIIKKINT